MKHLLLIPLLALVLLGCGQNGAVSAKKLSSLDCTDSNCSEGDVFPVRVQKVEGVVSHRQLLPNFQKCLDLPTVSETTKAAYKESISNLPLEGHAKDVSAPMLMAVLKVASEICTDRVNLEKSQATRKFFSGFNFGTTANSEQLIMDKTLHTLGVSCWGRSLTTFELDTIKQHIASRNDTSAAVYACTAVLSSIQAIRF